MIDSDPHSRFHDASKFYSEDPRDYRKLWKSLREISTKFLYSVSWSDNVVLLELPLPKVFDVDPEVFVVSGLQEGGCPL